MLQKLSQKKDLSLFSADKTLPLVVSLVVIVTFLVYRQALNAGFVNVDDPDYVLNNPLIRQLNIHTLISVFTQAHIGWWMPFTWLSFAVDYHFWKYNPYGYHLTNVVLHAVNSGLVVLIADQLLKLGPGAETRKQENVEWRKEVGRFYYPALIFLAGLLWSIHPLRVESVAWVTERKDVLNGFFSFGSILFYLRYAKRKALSDGNSHASWEFWLSFALFLMSLMAKSVSVVLPLMLLVLDWYPLGRLRRARFLPLLLEKAPYLAASAIMSLVTLTWAAKNQYLVTYEMFPFSQRMVVSGNAMWEYIRMLFFPFNLSPFNVIPDPIPFYYTISTVLVVIACMFITIWKRLPWLKAAFMCFLLPLLPVLAFFQNGDQAFADRFTYLSSLLPAIVASFVLVRFTVSQQAVWRRSLLALSSAALLIIYFSITLRLIGVWQSSETYWTRVVEIQPTAISYKERGRYYHSIGRYNAAVEDFTKALGMIPDTLKPYEYNFYAFRGESLRGAGLLVESVKDFSKAISIFPHPSYFYHRGLALQALGRTGEADEDFRRSNLEKSPILWFDAPVFGP